MSTPSYTPMAPGYRYQHWQGNNTPLCNGRCMIGPDVSVLLCNVFLIIVNMVMFFTWVAAEIHAAVIVFCCIILVFVFGNLFCATFVEPGILPRAEKNHWRLSTEPAPTTIVNGIEVPLKFCRTCNIFRPPRSKHCRDCDNCVEEFDHHCPWVSNCVGKRNYRFFVGFLISVTVLDAYVLFWSSWLVIGDAIDNGLSNAVSQNLTASIEILISFFFGWCLCSLSGFHCYLIATNTTTNEQIKGTGLENDASCSGNCSHFFCDPVPRSKIHLRARLPYAVAVEPREEKRVDPKDPKNVEKV